MKFKAFTLSEVLITIGIIGIIAAMTLPAILTKTEKQETVARLKKAYSVLSQGIKHSELVNGEISTWPVGSQIKDMNEYFEKYWKPFYKKAKYCESATSCGYISNFPWKNLNGDKVNWNIVSGTSRIIFMLADGTFIFIPRNTYGESNNIIYLNVIYFYIDLNGPKNPNILGKDVFMFTMKDGNTLRPYGYDVKYNKLNCNKNSSANANDCTTKIIADGWTIKEDYPW